MALTYNNVYSSFILDPLKFLIKEEFGVTVSTDSFEGRQSFLIIPLIDVLDDLRGRGQSRIYTIGIDYQYQKGGTFKYDVTTHLSNIAERVKRKIDDNRNYRVSQYWIDMGMNWADADTTWAENRTNYLWHSGAIIEINYEQEEDDIEGNENKRTVRTIFECFREEAIA